MGDESIRKCCNIKLIRQNLVNKDLQNGNKFFFAGTIRNVAFYSHFFCHSNRQPLPLQPILRGWKVDRLTS